MDMREVNDRCRRCGEMPVNSKRLCFECENPDASQIVRWSATKDQEFAAATEVGAIARDLIASWHAHLEGAYLFYVFVKNTPVVQRREVWGRMKVISGLPSWLMSKAYPGEGTAEPFFVMEISHAVWLRIGYLQRIALVDHELSHCVLRDGNKPALAGHDVNEFTRVIRRQGLWTEDVREMLEAAREADEAPLLAATVGVSMAADFH